MADVSTVGDSEKSKVPSTPPVGIRKAKSVAASVNVQDS